MDITRSLEADDGEEEEDDGAPNKKGPGSLAALSGLSSVDSVDQQHFDRQLAISIPHVLAMEPRSTGKILEQGKRVSGKEGVRQNNNLYSQSVTSCFLPAHDGDTKGVFFTCQAKGALS